MKVGKKEKNLGEEIKPQWEQVQADHEQFLEAFEKPTQIYRFLRARHLLSPTFLHRNLSYMTGRLNRKKNTRENFKVDTLLAKAEDKHRKEMLAHPDGMKLNITGLFDSGSPEQTAELEAFLTKTNNRKRKVSCHDITSSSVTEVCIGKTLIPCNPDKNKVQPIYLPVESSLFQGNCDVSPGQGYTLHMRVRCPCASKSKTKFQEDEPHPSKRRKSRSGGVIQDDGSSAGIIDDTDIKKDAAQRIYGAHLVVFDNQKHCQLTDGDYELVLADLQQEAAYLSHQKPSAWQVVSGGKSINQNAVFSICPTLKFSLSWQHPQGETENQLATQIKKEPQTTACGEYQQQRPLSSQPNKKRIFYQFMYNNNTCQQTEARDDSTCPWCLMNCYSLYPLIKHLRICHPRFLFTYSEHPKGARIDVSINEHYDGSYSGNPQDLYTYTGFAYSRKGPVQRMPLTQVLVCKPPKVIPDLAEFEDTNTCEEHTPIPMVAGHNRLYFHTLTCALQWPAEIAIDSDGQLDPQWLRQKTQNLIDDFTDVNEGEKEIMKMWNVHVMHHNFIGDCQLPVACAAFVEEYGPQVIRLNLFGNFMLHLVNLYDFGLIKPELIYRTMMQLFRLQHKLKNGEDTSRYYESQHSNFSIDSVHAMDTDCDEEVASVVGL